MRWYVKSRGGWRDKAEKKERKGQRDRWQRALLVLFPRWKEWDVFGIKSFWRIQSQELELQLEVDRVMIRPPFTGGTWTQKTHGLCGCS
jgi:hypothetical protein